MEAAKAADDAPLSRLLLSCANIRKRSRILRTLSSSSTKRKRQPATVAIPVDSNSYIQRMREEQQKAEVLDRRIWEYRAAIERMKLRRKRSLEQEKDAAVAGETPNPMNSNIAKATTTKAISLQQRLLRTKVMDETLRQQQECLLLSRITMSQPAVRVARASIFSTGNNLTDPTVTLVQEAAQCRNKLVKKALETQRAIDKIKQDLREAHSRGKELQERNRAAWVKLQQLRQQEEQENDNSLTLVSLGKTANDDSDDDIDAHRQKLQRLARETVILKRVLADVIAQLNWSKDERLQETLLRLE